MLSRICLSENYTRSPLFLSFWSASSDVFVDSWSAKPARVIVGQLGFACDLLPRRGALISIRKGLV